MYKNVKVSTRAAPGFIEKMRAGLAKSFDAPGEVGHAKCNVVNSFATFREELSDYRVLFGWLEKFDSRAIHGQHRNVYFFMSDRFARRNTEAELLLVKLERAVERPHCDAEMIDTNVL